MGRVIDLVTGATGFLGPHLVQALVAKGRRVRCIVRDRGRAAPLVALGADVQQGELLDPDAVARALVSVERVFHLAGGGKVSATSAEGLAALRAANVAPVKAVVDAAGAAGVTRVIVFSSISAMGVQLDTTLDEDSPCRPKTPHEIAKYESEQVALESGRRGGVPVVILRPSQIYGPGDVRSEIPKLLRLARLGLVPLFGGGSGRVPWVFVSDVVDATLSAADRPAAVGRTYIVSDAESYRFADVVHAMARSLGRERGGIAVPRAIAEPAIAAVERAMLAFGRDPVFTRHRLRSIMGHRSVSIERARRELGYVPRVGLLDGIERTVRWVADQGMR
ncbi:MAG: NAD-dependent epimerase/dehydratase family protein [Polyangiaceae bacterium]